jgi:hypothetical protein
VGDDEMIKIIHKGNFNNTEKFLNRCSKLDYLNVLERYGKEGVSALASATPKDSGETANSWNYQVSHSSGVTKIEWTNSNIVDGVPIAIILQYGHATANGGYVQGRDYINPAIQPIFDKIANELWREVIT